MWLLSVLLISAGLSVDSLSIGVSYSLRGIKTPWTARIIMTVISAVFTALAVFLGGLLLELITAEAAKIISSVMLFSLGVYIVYEAVLKSPVSCDFDSSKHIDSIEALYLGASLSIDSFGAGIGFSVAGLGSYIIPLSVGLCQLAFLCLGSALGEKINKKMKTAPKTLVAFSGIIIVAMSVIKCLI